MGNIKIINIEEGTILIDDRLRKSYRAGRERFTIAHEISHWILHRTYYSPSKQRYNFCIQQSRGVNNLNSTIAQYAQRQSSKENEEYWIENQADRLAAALLMPRKTFVEASLALFRKHNVNTDFIIKNSSIENQIIYALSKVFDVSKSATKIRMENLGLLRK